MEFVTFSLPPSRFYGLIKYNSGNNVRVNLVFQLYFLLKKAAGKFD